MKKEVVAAVSVADVDDPVVVVAAAAVAVVVKTALSTFDRQVVNFEV